MSEFLIRRCVCFSLCWIAISAASLSSVFGQDTVDFTRDIRPILSDKCFNCHGPDPENREADLRLDVRDSAVGDDRPIVVGNVDQSSLIERITSDDPDLKMPPESSEKSLTEREIDLLKQWVKEGAAYAEHWAFVPPVRPELPELSDSGWEQNPIDRFVLHRMNQHKLSPSQPADRTTLIRRMYLDLIGLPPSPDVVDRFTTNKHPHADQKVIEQLLDSNHFGERWARWWLDAARYSDSDGYEKDKQRSVWFYRDWVINAMNKDMSYDQFIVEQIAGDLIPNATQDQRVATGFLRNSMVNEEGGADPEQFRVEGMFDRIDAIGKAVLGLTTQCAQCHSHKYDPLTQNEYYQMFAALNDFHEATLTVYTPDELAERRRILREIRQIENEIKSQIPDWKQQLAAWEQSTQTDQPVWEVMVPTDIPFDGQKFRKLRDGSIVGESYAPTKTSPTFSLKTNLKDVTAFRLEALTHSQLPHNGPGRSIYGTGALSEFEVEIAPADNPSQKQKLKWVSATADVNPAESSLPSPYREKNASDDDRITGPIEFAIDGNRKTAWTTDNGPGRRNQNRNAVFVPESPVAQDGDVIVSFRLVMNHGGWNSDDNQNYLLGRYRFSVTRSANPSADVVPSRVRRFLKIPPAERTAQQTAAIFSAWRQSVADLRTQNDAIEALWAQHPEGHSQLVAKAMPKGRPSFVLTRGDFLKPGEAVQPGAPEFMGGMADSNAPDRLDFANWLVDRRTPTTARAIVNRIWQAYFGQGLVTSPEDLGSQSLPPSHPELLDWLAVELMDNNWSLKHIHKLIVSSATYQQSSHVTPELLASDPLNRWLARGARFRVNAEIVRDIALSASGLLNPQVGGPSVYPQAPDFLFQPPASYGPKNWFTSTGAEAQRRSLYVHSYRSVPYPPLQVFDAPKGDSACVRRNRSNTPLQALVVMNEPQFVECAQAMAQRILDEADSSDEARLRYAHRLCVSRDPSAAELELLNTLLQSQRSRLQSGELNALALLGESNATTDNNTEQKNDLAAWMIISRTLLNLDETITRE